MRSAMLCLCLTQSSIQTEKCALDVEFMESNDGKWFKPDEATVKLNESMQETIAVEHATSNAKVVNTNQIMGTVLTERAKVRAQELGWEWCRLQ